jgi:hypothetical protein
MNDRTRVSMQLATLRLERRGWMDTIMVESLVKERYPEGDANTRIMVAWRQLGKINEEIDTLLALEPGMEQTHEGEGQARVC